MRLRSVVTTVAALSALFAVGMPTVSAQSAASADLSVYLLSGSCDENAAEEPIVIGTIPVLEPQAVGLPGADDAAVGTGTIIGFSVSDLPDLGAHIEVVAADGESLACGEIGGSFRASGELLVGLAEQGDSNITGVAFLAPSKDGASTDATVFVSGEDLWLIASEAEAALGAAAMDSSYLTSVAAITDRLGGSVETFNGLINAAKVGDPDWTRSVATEFATWGSLKQELAAMTPPAGYEDAHQALLDALDAYNEGATALAQGIDNSDQQALAEADALLAEGDDLLAEAQALFDEAAALAGDVTSSASGASDDAAAYVAAIAAITEKVSGSMDTFDALVAAPRVGEGKWTKAVAAEFGAWDAIAAEVTGMTPPAGFEDAHQALADALSAYGEAADAFATGIDNNDQASLDNAATLFSEGDDLLAEAEALFEEAKAAAGI